MIHTRSTVTGSLEQQLFQQFKETYSSPKHRAHQALSPRPHQHQRKAEVDTITARTDSEIGKAIICFQYVERIKSELIIASKLIDRLNELSGDEFTGAAKMYSFFLEALQGEINIAFNVLGMKEFETAGAKVEEAANKAHFNQYEEAIRLLSEAISNVASSGQWAMQTLKNNGFL